MSAVFTDASALPSWADIEAQLRIGSASPEVFDAGKYTACTTAECTAHTGVTVYTTGTASSPLLDATAIFQIVVNGTRTLNLANVASTVQVLGGAFTFRNPPAFMSLQHPARRDATYETQALLDHLLYHRNTAPFTASRLIQNLVTSNPSPRYVQAVATAFKTGIVKGHTFSGEYGDLAATAAAILLDTEARSLVVQHDPTYGSLRDPLQKYYHFLRAMEFVPRDGMEIAPYAYQLLGRIGMAVYMSPTVFNFYLPMYQPPGAVTAAQLWAPATQLSIMPNVIGLQSMLTGLIKDGMRDCYSGFSSGYGCGWDSASGGRLGFMPPNASDVDSAVASLDLLLSGGRLSDHGRVLITQAYQATYEAQGAVAAVQVAQQLFAVSPEFHTNTEPSVKAWPAKQLPPKVSLSRPYKAIVVLYFAGGADTFNMVVPHSGCGDGSVTSYEQYLLTRTGAALPQESLLQIQVDNSSQPCSTFGMHKNLPFVKDLFQNGEAAIWANVGNLIEPTNKAMYYNRKRPRSLYSHEHQQFASRTLHPQFTSSSGVLGKIVDALDAGSGGSAGSPPFKTAAYSITRTTSMLNGKTAQPITLSASQGAVQYYKQQRAWAEAASSGSWHNIYALGAAGISDMLRVTEKESGNVFAETSNQLIRDSLVDSEALGSLLDNATTMLTQDWEPLMDQDKSLAWQIYQVARLITARSARSAERDVFYIDVGGWDMHSNIVDGMVTQCAIVSNALEKFVSEMKGQNIWDGIVVQTSSDFARTLVFNGLGTDHSWGGNHFTFGGKVKGSKMHGSFPSLDLQSEVCVDQRRGSLIPTSPWEAIWSPIAEWFGVEESKLNEVLPNRPNFPTGQLGTDWVLGKIPPKADVFHE